MERNSRPKAVSKAASVVKYFLGLPNSECNYSFEVPKKGTGMLDSV
jgi:hypothetical protein